MLREKKCGGGGAGQMAPFSALFFASSAGALFDVGASKMACLYLKRHVINLHHSLS